MKYKKNQNWLQVWKATSISCSPHGTDSFYIFFYAMFIGATNKPKSANLKTSARHWLKILSSFIDSQYKRKSWIECDDERGRSKIRPEFMYKKSRSWFLLIIEGPVDLSWWLNVKFPMAFTMSTVKKWRPKLRNCDYSFRKISWSR